MGELAHDFVGFVVNGIDEEFVGAFDFFFGIAVIIFFKDKSSFECEWYK